MQSLELRDIKGECGIVDMKDTRDGVDTIRIEGAEGEVEVLIEDVDLMGMRSIAEAMVGSKVMEGEEVGVLVIAGGMLTIVDRGWVRLRVTIRWIGDERNVTFRQG